MDVRKDRAMLPAAIMPTAFFPIRRPKKPLMIDPINGNRGTRQVSFNNILLLPLQQIEFIKINRWLVAM